MQAAFLGAINEIARGAAQALVFWGGSPSCPNCSPVLHCPDCHCGSVTQLAERNNGAALFLLFLCVVLAFLLGRISTRVTQSGSELAIASPSPSSPPLQLTEEDIVEKARAQAARFRRKYG